MNESRLDTIRNKSQIYQRTILYFWKNPVKYGIYKHRSRRETVNVQDYNFLSRTQVTRCVSSVAKCYL